MKITVFGTEEVEIIWELDLNLRGEREAFLEFHEMTQEQLDELGEKDLGLLAQEYADEEYGGLQETGIRDRELISWDERATVKPISWGHSFYHNKVEFDYSEDY